MSASPENPSAFPFDYFMEGGDAHYVSEGMSLRDYFAGLAIAECLRHTTRAIDEGGSCLDVSEGPQQAAIDAYIVADAMLAARGRKETP